MTRRRRNCFATSETGEATRKVRLTLPFPFGTAGKTSLMPAELEDQSVRFEET
mgnify:CR=1